MTVGKNGPEENDSIDLTVAAKLILHKEITTFSLYVSLQNKLIESHTIWLQILFFT